MGTSEKTPGDDKTLDISTPPDVLLGVIDKLRNENASNRVNNNKLTSDIETLNNSNAEMKKIVQDIAAKDKKKADEKLLEDGKFETLLADKEILLKKNSDAMTVIVQDNEKLRKFQTDVMESKLELISDETTKENLRQTGDIGLIDSFLKLQTQNKNSVGAENSGQEPKTMANFSPQDWQNYARDFSEEYMQAMKDPVNILAAQGK